MTALPYAPYQGRLMHMLLQDVPYPTLSIIATTLPAILIAVSRVLS